MLSFFPFLFSSRLLHSDVLFFFFFNDTATTEIYTLSLHDALPIYLDHTGLTDRDVEPAERGVEEHDVGHAGDLRGGDRRPGVGVHFDEDAGIARAEEAAARDVDVQAVRTGVRYRHDTLDRDRIGGADDRDLRR